MNSEAGANSEAVWRELQVQGVRPAAAFKAGGHSVNWVPTENK
jgi:hypothetical protein